MNPKLTSPLLLFVFAILFSTNTNAQLADGATVPDWTFTDTDGNSHNLYSYLDQGMNVVLDMSATWCPPCWSYHNTHVLENLYQAKGPNGTGEVMVFHVEADPNTNQQCIYGQAGCNSTSLGDWTLGVTYPILNLNTADASWMNNNYNINFFPTLYNICPDRRVWEVGQPQQPTWENWILSCSLEASGMVTSNENCFGQNTGAVNTSSMGGFGTTNYQWSNGASTPTITGVSAGTYSCTVTEAQGYFVEIGPFAVTGPAAPLAINVTNNTTITCAGIPTGSISTSASGGTAGYQYQWSNGATQPNISGLSGGIYSLVVTDFNGCVAAQTFTINEPTALTLIGTPVSATCGQNNGIIVLTAAGGTSGYSYDIGTGPSTNNQFFNLPPGAYTATVTDANGCTETTTVALAFIPPPLSAAGPDQSLDCALPQVTLQGGTSTSGNNIVYTWTTNTGNFISGATTPTPVVDATGLYTLIVTDINTGCIATDDVIVLGNTTLPTAVTGPNGELNCTTSNLTLDGNGSSIGNSFSYQWTTTNGNIISGTNSLTPTVDAAGTYVLAVFNSINQCFAEAMVEVTNNTALPSAVATASGSIDCNNTIVTIDGSASSSNGNTAFEWLDNNNISIGNQSTINAASAGTYTLIITDTDNGCTSSTQVTVTENIQVPQSVASVSNNIDCNNTVATLDATGSTTGPNISYEWTDASGVSIGTGSSVTVSIAGNYSLIVFDNDNGCNAQSSATVTVNTNTPTSSIAVSGNIDCSNNTVTLDGSASSSGNNISYEWLDENGSVISTGNTVTVSNSGTYSLTVIDTQSGCVTSSSAVVTGNNTPPTANIANNGELTCGVSSIILDGSSSSAGSNFSYEWLDGSGNSIGTNIILDASSAGSYQLIVTNNSNGCASSATAVVTQNNNLPTANAGASSVLTCTNGTATLDGSSSSTGNDFSYEWQDANGTTISTDLITQVSNPGTYNLIVTNNSNNCQTSDAVDISIDSNTPTATASTSGELNCASTSVTLDGSNSSTGNNIEYEWQDNNGNTIGTNAMITVTNAGTYTLIVFNNQNGCIAQTSAIVTTNSTLPTATIANGGALTCSVNTITLDGTNSSTGNNIAYEWLDANGNSIGTNNTIDVSSAGVYELIVTNTNNGCATSTTATVTQSATLPTADAGIGNTLTCNTNSVILDGSNSSAGGNISYEWTDVTGTIIGTNSTTQVNNPGLYNLTVYDNTNGCQSQSSVTVTIDNSLPNVNVVSSGALSCSVTTVTLDGSSSGANISFTWLDATGTVIGTNSTIDVNTTGDYELVVTNDNNGCTNSTVTNVPQSAVPPMADAGNGEQLNCINSTVILDGGNSSTGSNFTYEWIDVSGNVIGTNITVEVNSNAVYNLIVTNTDNGCTATSSTEVLLNISDPMAEAGTASQLDCASASVTLDGSGSSSGSNFTYVWTDANGNIISTDLTAQATTEGIYNLMVTDNNNGCTGTDQVTVTASNDFPTAVVATSNDINCANSTVQLNGTGSSSGAVYEYQWLNSSGVSIGTNLTVDVSTAGVYTLVVINTTNGCTASNEITVLENTATPMADANSMSALDCNTSSTIVDGVGSATGNDITYEWQDPNGNVISNDLSTEVSSVGVYTLTVTNTETGCTNTASTEVVSLTIPPTSNAGTGGALNCTITSLILDGSNSTVGGNISYEWTTNNGNITSGASTLNPTIDVAGIYILTVTNDDNGCIATSEVTVEQIPSMDISLANQTDVSCFGNTDGSASIDVAGGAGGYTYNWSNGNTTATINNVPAGEYTVMVTDTDNCTDTYLVTINEPAELGGSVTSFDVSCNGTNDGQATAAIMGANTPTYLWSNGMTTNAITGLSAGDYTVTLSDNGNCPIEQVVTISEPTAIVGTVLEIVNVVCANASDGSATVEGQGGVGTLTYLWSVGINTPTATNLSAGTYTVSITDGNFCTNTLEVTIEANDTEMPIAVAQNITLPLNQNGDASIDVSMVDNGSSDNCGITNMVLDLNQFDCNNLGENTVTLSVVDGAGNANTTTAIITIIDDLAPTIETCPDNITSNSCNGISYDLPTAIDNCGVSAPMLVNGLASGEVFPEGVTEVVYMFSDASGNEVICNFIVTVENSLNLLVDNITAATDNQANGSVDVSITGGTLPYTYLWTSNGAIVSNSEDLTAVPSGEFELLVTDDLGCIITSEIIIIDNMVANDNVLLEKFITIHPNPTSGMIFVDVNLPQSSNVQLDVFDITGRSLMTLPAQDISHHLLELDLTPFTSGVYILKIKVDDDVLAKRFILQK